MTVTARAQRGWQIAAIAIAVIVFVLALIGIRSGAASAGTTAQASRAASVEIVSFAFKPGTLTIGAGSKVVFSNTSSRAHTATRRGSFDTGRIRAGRSATIAFNHRGTFPYHCKIHPFMKGKIVVD